MARSVRILGIAGSLRKGSYNEAPLAEARAHHDAAHLLGSGGKRCAPR